MKSTTNPLVAGCVAFFVAGCSQNAGTDPNTSTAIAKASEETASLRAMLGERDGELTQLSRGTSLLLTMAREPERYRTLTDFVTTIGAGQLRCEIRELDYYPLVVYIYQTSYYLPDGSLRPTFDRRSALVLVDAKTHRVIDFKFGTGYRSDDVSNEEPHYEGSWDREDGISVRYRILPSGFKDSQSEVHGQQPPISKGAWSYKNGKPESVTFDYGTELTAEDIVRLSGCESLTRISMGYAGIDSEYVTVEGDLLKLGRLKNLEDVHLCKDGINNDDLKFIALLPKIHTLEFNADNGYDGAPICSDRCADHLSSAKTLRKLLIHDGQFTDKFVAQITQGLPDLEELWLSSPELTDESLRLLAERCKQLKALSITSDHFTAEGLKHLDKLKKLEERSVSSPPLREDYCEHERSQAKGR